MIPAEMLSASLPRVDADEIAFALALFDSAANGRIHAPGLGVSGFPVEENLYELIEAEPPMEEGTLAGPPTFAPFSRAISVLWHHYKADERQRTIWCRVVAFHAMMAKTRGSLVQRWTIKHDNNPSHTSLHAAVVSAVAEAPLGEFGEFDALEFAQCAKRFDDQAARVAPADFGPSMVNRSPVDSTGALLPRLHAPLAGLTGCVGLRALISRAMNANCASYPWLKGAYVTSEGVLVADSQHSAHELAEGEAAVTSSLLKSLIGLVGGGVAANILPEVFAGNVAHIE